VIPISLKNHFQNTPLTFGNQLSLAQRWIWAFITRPVRERALIQLREFTKTTIFQNSFLLKSGLNHVEFWRDLVKVKFTDAILSSSQGYSTTPVYLFEIA
jgi:hypothetical protein